MHFGASSWLYALFLIPFLGWLFLLSRRRRKRLQERFGDTELVRHLVRGADEKRRKRKERILLAGLVGVVFALAHPQYGEKERPVKREGIDIVFALDTSLSMLAEDLAPNRLEHATREVESVLSRLKGDRVGIVSFAGTSVPTCPLTVDYGAVRIFLGGVDTWTVPTAGTAIARALRRSIHMLEESSAGSKAVILLTDGEDHEGDVMEAAEEAKAAGILIFPIGLGSSEGELIPMPKGERRDGRFKQDDKGEFVVTKRDDSTLESVARLTGGRYFTMRDEPDAMDRILDVLSGMEKQEFRSRIMVIREERYIWFLLPATILILIEFLLSTQSGRKREAWRGRVE